MELIKKKTKKKKKKQQKNNNNKKKKKKKTWTSDLYSLSFVRKPVDIVPVIQITLKFTVPTWISNAKPCV